MLLALEEASGVAPVEYPGSDLVPGVVYPGSDLALHTSKLKVVMQDPTPKLIPELRVVEPPAEVQIDVRCARFTQSEVFFYGVVSLETQRVVEFFATRAEAEARLARVLQDAPELDELLRIEALEFSTEPN